MSNDQSFKNYRDLVAWQKAMDLVATTYRVSGNFPKEEQYGLTSQLRRALVSIPSNIAEGHARRSTNEFIHFLSVAHGSLAEVETQILLAERLGYMDASDVTSIMNLAAEVGRLINGLIKSLKTKD